MDDLDTLFDFEHQHDDVQIEDIFAEPLTGEIRRAEGVSVENDNVRVCEGTEKVIASEIPIAPSQVTESASASHLLGSTTRQDAVDLAAHSHTQTSHFDSSQKLSTSEILVSLAPYLATLHSGVTIEQRSSISPASTSIECTSSLAPSREHIESHTESLRGPVGTAVVMPMPGIPRGSAGNPTGVTPMPAPQVGHTVESTVVSTGILREPGVSVTPTAHPSSSFTVDPTTRAFVEA